MPHASMTVDLLPIWPAAIPEVERQSLHAPDVCRPGRTARKPVTARTPWPQARTQGHSQAGDSNLPVRQFIVAASALLITFRLKLLA